MAVLTRYSNSELLELPDCEGLLENGRCNWLNVSFCVGSDCLYYHKIDNQEIAQARLRSLDEETQERIAKKYYGGYRPWSNRAERYRRE